MVTFEKIKQNLSKVLAKEQRLVEEEKYGIIKKVDPEFIIIKEGSHNNKKITIEMMESLFNNSDLDKKTREEQFNKEFDVEEDDIEYIYKDTELLLKKFDVKFK